MSHSLPEVAQLCVDGKLCRARAEVADIQLQKPRHSGWGMVKEPQYLHCKSPCKKAMPQMDLETLV